MDKRTDPEHAPGQSMPTPPKWNFPEKTASEPEVAAPPQDLPDILNVGLGGDDAAGGWLELNSATHSQQVDEERYFAREALKRAAAPPERGLSGLVSQALASPGRALVIAVVVILIGGFGSFIYDLNTTAEEPERTSFRARGYSAPVNSSRPTPSAPSSSPSSGSSAQPATVGPITQCQRNYDQTLAFCNEQQSDGNLDSGGWLKDDPYAGSSMADNRAATCASMGADAANFAECDPDYDPAMQRICDTLGPEEAAYHEECRALP